MANTEKDLHETHVFFFSTEFLFTRHKFLIGYRFLSTVKICLIFVDKSKTFEAHYVEGYAITSNYRFAIDLLKRGHCVCG